MGKWNEEPHLPNFYSINPIYDGLHGQSRISRHRQTAPSPMHTLPDKAAAKAISSVGRPISTPSSESELRNLSFMKSSIRHKGGFGIRPE